MSVREQDPFYGQDSRQAVFCKIVDTLLFLILYSTIVMDKGFVWAILRSLFVGNSIFQLLLELPSILSY